MNWSTVANGVVKRFNNTIPALLAGIITLPLFSMSSMGEDIDVFISESIKNASTRPKVLIIFDTSGSMNGKKPFKYAYDPEENYQGSSDNTYTYYAKGDSAGQIPQLNDPLEQRKFLTGINSCVTAQLSLAEYGIYTGRIREYKFEDDDGKWITIPETTGELIEAIDCEDDVIAARLDENTFKQNAKMIRENGTELGLANGVPVNGAGSNGSPNLHTPNSVDSNVIWSGTYVTLYSANYLRWQQEVIADLPTRSGMDVAKESLQVLIRTSPGIDFGLMVFNESRPHPIAGTKGETGEETETDKTAYFEQLHHGARVVFPIKENTDDNRADLIAVSNLIGAHTATPLCESLYEASRYLGGLSVDFGDKDLAGGEKNGEWDYDENSGKYYTATPLRDDSVDTEVTISVDGQVALRNYISPFSSCSDKIHIIFMTDGEPWNDDFDSLTGIQALVDMTAGSENPIVASSQTTSTKNTYTADGIKYKFKNDNTKYGQRKKGVEYSYLPTLAGWMNNNDINPNLPGKQTVSTYTIGFTDSAASAEPLLRETALKGGGKYTSAPDSASLTAAFTSILSNLVPANNTLTAASVAPSAADRTQTLDFVYYAMFSPDSGPRWQGNLKKYKIVGQTQLGKNLKPAINPNTGVFASYVQSYWSENVDGDIVSEGGVSEAIRKMDNRVIYSNIGNGNTLKALTIGDAASSSNVDGFKTKAELAASLGVSYTGTDDDDNITDALDWIRGIDVDDQNEDGNITDKRMDAFGDPLHSKPLVIQYGIDNTYIFVGTNHGVLHIFKDNGDSVTEVLAFMPKEFISSSNTFLGDLRANLTTKPKIYGIDGRITSMVVDNDGDGTPEKAMIFFGLRRGGSSYYGLDVTNLKSYTGTTNRPTVEWVKNSSHYPRLGESWSQPKIAYSKLNIVGGVAKPVLIFGGGYDEQNDNVGIGDDTTDKGNAIYMVDAASGTILWSLADGGHTDFDGTDSIPARIATLDSDADGFVDRLYAGDTGGNIWRVDMPGANTYNFSVIHLAQLGAADGETDIAQDRRFMNQVDIVRTYITHTIKSGTEAEPIYTKEDVPYVALLIGSGDRTNPLGITTQDSFFMIKDINIETQQFTDNTGSNSDNLPLSVGTTTFPINIDELADYSNDSSGNTVSYSAQAAASTKAGWKINFAVGTGEKITSKSVVSKGIAYFTSYVPPVLGASAQSCDVANGAGWFYAVNLATASSIENWNEGGGVGEDKRKVHIGEQILDTPTPFFHKKINEETEKLVTTGGILIGGDIIPRPEGPELKRTTLTITED